jgi:hypothetical protein
MLYLSTLKVLTINIVSSLKDYFWTIGAEERRKQRRKQWLNYKQANQLVVSLWLDIVKASAVDVTAPSSLPCTRLRASHTNATRHTPA